MGRNHKFEKQCRYCGEELTTQNTSKNFVNDGNYICFDCSSDRMKSGGYRVRNLEQVYDPNKNKIHKSIDKKAQQHTDQVEIREEELVGIIVPKEKKYPKPKGRAIIIKLREKECSKCNTVLTTTNAYQERVRQGIYICKDCEDDDREERLNDPLYYEKKEIKKILHVLYRRRRLKQFTWEYVKERFKYAASARICTVDEEEYAKTVKLFGEEYAAKRFRPRYSYSLQASFGDLTTKEGCKKLLALFEYELYKSKHAGARRKKKHEAKQYLKLFDPAYRTMTSDKNTGSNPDDYSTHDKFCEEAYHGGKFVPAEIHDQKWDPYTKETT